MDDVFAAPLAVLFEFEAVFERLLVLGRKIVDAMAVGALELDEVVLGHRKGVNRLKITVEPTTRFERVACCLQNSCSTIELRRQVDDAECKWKETCLCRLWRHPAEGGGKTAALPGLRAASDADRSARLGPRRLKQFSPLVASTH